MSTSPSEILDNIEAGDETPTVRDLRDWLDSLRSEWDVVTAYVSELRKLLEPEDVETAMSLCGIDPSSVVNLELPQGTPDKATSPAEPPPGSVPQDTPAALSTPLDVADESLEDADELTINRRLVEVLGLLQRNLQTLTSGAKREVSVPPEVTQAIAQEVAGRVQRTLATASRETPEGEEQKVDSYWAGAGAGSKQPFRRIPLDDIESVIDELTRNS